MEWWSGVELCGVRETGWGRMVVSRVRLSGVELNESWSVVECVVS